MNRGVQPAGLPVVASIKPYTENRPKSASDTLPAATLPSATAVLCCDLASLRMGGIRLVSSKSLRKTVRAVLWRATRTAYDRLPGTARASLNLYLYLLRYGDRPEVVDPPRANSVLVLAPHPDDETIGCGGVIRRYTLAGTRVAVVVVSDGRRGDPALNRRLTGSAKTRRAEEELIARRRGEAAAAAALLGVRDLVFLDQPDGEVAVTAEAVARLRSELQRLAPDVVFLPFLSDQHPDHLQTNALFLEAAAREYSDRTGPAIWAYETWSPLPANKIVDISTVAETKWDALRCHESQLRYLDFVSATRGLNAYRWLATLQGRGFAEAFYACSLVEYRELYAVLTRPAPVAVPTGA